jgi:methylmalonyl-CoA mutase N-terminal domain/subunit
MFSKETQDEDRALVEKWQKQRSELYKGLEPKAATLSGIPVKPLYTAGDIEPIDYTFINFNLHGFGLPEDTRQRMDLLAKEGMTGHVGEAVYDLVYDRAVQGSLDPDAPGMRGSIGYCGVSAFRLKDFETLFQGIDLSRTHVNHIASFSDLPVLAMYIVNAERQGFSPQQLRGSSPNVQYKQWHCDSASFPPKSAFKVMIELIKYCTWNMPRWNTVDLSGYNPAEAGANALQELAFALALDIALGEECVKVGLKPDDFLSHFAFHIRVGNDFFEDIAKLRALRRLFARINKERFGCQNPKALRARIFTQTAGSHLTAQQPRNNIVRAALHTLEAILGGAEAIATDSYDEALALPTEEAATLALRTQQIILHETRIPNVCDPLGGSYYVEWLTSKIEEEVYKLIQEIERLGGYIKCWETGWFKQEIMRSASKWRDDVDSGQEVVVGVNKFVTEERWEEEGTPIFSLDPDTERIAIQRVREHKEKRDNSKTRAALDNLKDEAKKVADGDGYLMPAMIEAVRADATLGETMQVLKEVFGWGFVW